MDNDFIIDNTMVATLENLIIMLNDEKYPFGHGYCLASALMNIDKELLEYEVVDKRL